MLTVPTLHGLAQLRSTPGVSDHLPQAILVHAVDEVLHLLQEVDGSHRLTSDDMCHDLRQNTEVQAGEICRLWEASGARCSRNVSKCLQVH